MYRIGSPRDIRIREMAGFKAFIEVDLADEASRKPYRELYEQYIAGAKPYRELYEQYIAGAIDRNAFSAHLKFINEHYQSQKAQLSEETEMQLTATELKQLVAGR